MVQELEPIIKRLNEKGYSSGARKINDLVESLRQSGEMPQTLSVETVFHHLWFDYFPERKQISRDGMSVKLRKIESEIFEILIGNRNKLVPHAEIIKNVWGYTNVSVRDRSLVKSHIARIRYLLGGIGVEGTEVINTIHGVGYMLVDQLMGQPADAIVMERPIEIKEEVE